MFLFARFTLFVVLLLPLSTLAGPRRPLVNGTPTFVTSDGVQLYASISGQGTPCVFVHGGPGAWSGMPQQFIGPLVEDRFQMIWYDQRGSGRSRNDPNQNYSLARMVQDLEEIRLQLGLEKWVLMAHSFGGTIATAYAAQYPQHVQGLVLVECTLSLPEAMKNTMAAGLRYVPAAEQAFYRDTTQTLDARFGRMMEFLGSRQLFDKLQFQTADGPARVAEADKGNPGTGDFGGYGFRLPDYRQDFTALTPKIAAPVLVFTGAHDDCIGPEHYRLFRFPHQQVAHMQTGHVPFLEEPAAFQAAFRQWARRVR